MMTLRAFAALIFWSPMMALKVPEVKSDNEEVAAFARSSDFGVKITKGRIIRDSACHLSR